MLSLLRDGRHAFRVIRKNPVTSAVIVLTLGLGIGGNTAMFVGWDAWVLRPLDFDEPARLVALHETQLKQARHYNVSPSALRHWQEESRSFDGIESFQRSVFNFQSENDPERVQGARVTAPLFSLLGIEPVLGRHFLPEDDLPNGRAVALISHSLFERRFDSDPGVIGSTIRLDQTLHEVVGVMPRGFEFPEWAHVWTPLALDPVADERMERRLSTVARLRPGVTRDAAQADLSAVARRMSEQYPETHQEWGAEISPLRDEWSPPIVRLAITASLVCACFVLLIICANVANLMLAQATGRRQELAVRAALGASRARLIRQILTESIVLAIMGGVLGVVLGSWWVDWMKSWVPVEVPYLFRFDIDGRAALYTLAVAILTGVICSLAPVVRSSGFDVFETLKSGSARAPGGARAQRLRSVLVVGEFAVSMLLVVGALLMVKSFLREQQIEPGYRADGLLAVRLSLSGKDYEDPARRADFLDRALSNVAGIGEVEAAGAADFLPVSRSGYAEARLEVEGRPNERGEEPLAAYHGVTRSYLETLDVPLIEGRTFSAAEYRQRSDVVVVSRSLARRLWPGVGALQRRLRVRGKSESPWLRVIGVVDDVDPGHSIVINRWPKFQLYVPYGRTLSPMVSLVVRSGADPERLSSLLRSEIRRADAGIPVERIRSMSQIMDEVHWASRVFGQMFSLYAAIALAIAALGVYGITADAVSRRTHEMGVRLALGARPSELLRLVLTQALRLGVLGVGLGVLGALLTTRFMATMLYEVSVTDPTVFTGVATLLAIVAIVAAYLPARRASRVDPMQVLRFE